MIASIDRVGEYSLPYLTADHDTGHALSAHVRLRTALVLCRAHTYFTAVIAPSAAVI